MTAENALWLGAIVAIIAAVWIATAMLRRALRPREGPAPPAEAHRHLTIRLDVVVDDVEGQRAQRLASDASARMFSIAPDVSTITVHDRAGQAVAVHHRSVAERIREPLTGPASGPSRSLSRWEANLELPSIPAQHPDADDIEPIDLRSGPIVDHLDLPAQIRRALPDDARAIDIVEALLRLTGHPVMRDRDTLTVGDVAVIVVEAGTPGEDVLRHAYLRFVAARARAGVVIAMNPADLADAPRRERLEPHVSHVGPGALQRMADATALGGDPLAFLPVPLVA